MRISDWSSDVCSFDLLVHDAASLKQALWRGWMFGVGHFSVNDNWIQHAFTYQDKMPHWLGYAAPIALALYLAVYPAIAAGLARSEEHTSELQSLMRISYAVFCLKKKTLSTDNIVLELNDNLLQ